MKAVRQHRPRKIVVAVPNGAAETCEEFKAQVDEMIAPKWFHL